MGRILARKQRIKTTWKGTWRVATITRLRIHQKMRVRANHDGFSQSWYRERAHAPIHSCQLQLQRFYIKSRYKSASTESGNNYSSDLYSCKCIRRSKWDFVFRYCPYFDRFLRLSSNCWFSWPTLFEASRITYASARQGDFPAIFAKLYGKSDPVPVPAVVFQCTWKKYWLNCVLDSALQNLIWNLVAILSMFMLIPGNFDALVNYFSVASWIFYGFAASVVVIMRYREPHISRPFRSIHYIRRSVYVTHIHSQRHVPSVIISISWYLHLHL
jgi:hypothetical protein